MQELKELKGELKSPVNLPPYIVVVGPFTTSQKVFVVIREKLFEYKDILQAVNICFKSSVVLHTWSKLSNHIWAFLQNYVYKLESTQSPAFIQHLPVAVSEFFLDKIEPHLKAQI